MLTQIGIGSTMLAVVLWVWLNITMEAITLITGLSIISFGIHGLIVGWIGISGWILNILFGVCIIPRAYLKKSH